MSSEGTSGDPICPTHGMVPCTCYAGIAVNGNVCTVTGGYATNSSFGFYSDDKQATRIKTLELALKHALKHMLDELDRGYVLTYEPGAGEAWRKRYNHVISEIENAIMSEEP